VEVFRRTGTDADFFSPHGDDNPAAEIQTGALTDAGAAGDRSWAHQERIQLRLRLGVAILRPGDERVQSEVAAAYRSHPPGVCRPHPEGEVQIGLSPACRARDCHEVRWPAKAARHILTGLALRWPLALLPSESGRAPTLSARSACGWPKP
jgi:hypothetical protein